MQLSKHARYSLFVLPFQHKSSGDDAPGAGYELVPGSAKVVSEKTESNQTMTETREENRQMHDENIKDLSGEVRHVSLEQRLQKHSAIKQSANSNPLITMGNMHSNTPMPQNTLIQNRISISPLLGVKSLNLVTLLLNRSFIVGFTLS